MADGNNKLNAELRKVEDDLFAPEDFSSREPVPLDDVVKPLPVPEEDLNPVAAGFVPVREEESVRAVPEEFAHAIRTFSESRPLPKHDVFSEPLKTEVPPVAEPVPAEEPAIPVPEEKAVIPAPEEPPRTVPEEKSVEPVPEKRTAPPVQTEKPLPVPPVQKPARKPVSAPPSSAHRQVAVPDVDHASLGAILRQARNAAGLTAEQAADATKIRLDYIVGIENDDFKRLPPVVFIRAYSRTLGNLYKLDPPTLDAVMRRVDDLEPPADVPKQLLQKLEKDVQVSEEETKKLKRLLLYAGLVLALIVSLTVTCIVAAVIGSSRTPEDMPHMQSAQQTPPVQESDLEKLLPQQVPELKVLEPPAKR